MNEELTTTQRSHIGQLFYAVNGLYLFPAGGYAPDRFWRLTGPELTSCLRGHQAHGQQARTRPFITRFITLLGPDCTWQRLVDIYSGGEGLFENPQQPRAYRRLQSNGRPIGRPRVYARKGWARTSIVLTDEQKTAIKWKYNTIQNFINTGADYVLDLYQQHQQQGKQNESTRTIETT